MLRCYANLINLITTFAFYFTKPKAKVKNPKNNGQFNTTKLGRRFTSTCLKRRKPSIELKAKNNQIKWGDNQLGAYLAVLKEMEIYTPQD